MNVTIGSCSGPLDATLVRAYFELHDIPITITKWLDIEADIRDVVRAKTCLGRLRGQGSSLATELEASGRVEQFDDDLPMTPARTKPFDVSRHQAPVSGIKAGRPELWLARVRKSS